MPAAPSSGAAAPAHTHAALQIFVECAAGFVLAAAGAILSTAPFKPMKMSTEVKQR